MPSCVVFSFCHLIGCHEFSWNAFFLFLWTFFVTLNTGYRGSSSIPFDSTSSLIPASILINNDTLIMRGRFVPRIHSGDYNCIAKNAVGSTRSNPIHLQVQGEMLHYLLYVKKDEKHSFFMNSYCCVSSVDEGNWIWEHRSTLMSSSCSSSWWRQWCDHSNPYDTRTFLTEVITFEFMNVCFE